MNEQIAMIIRASLQSMTNAEWQVAIDGDTATATCGEFNREIVLADDPTAIKTAVDAVFFEYKDWLTTSIEKQLDDVESYLNAFPPNQRGRALKKWARKNKRSPRPRKPSPIRL